MKRKIRTAVACLAIVGSAAFIILFFMENQEELRLLAKVSSAEIAALVLLHMVYLLLHGYRYQVVLAKCSGQRVTFAPLFQIYVLARFLNTVVPQIGNVYRGVRLKKVFGVSYTLYASSFLSVAWMSAWFNALVAFAVVAVAVPELTLGPIAARWLLLALALGLGLGPFLLDWTLRSIPVWRGLRWLHAKLKEAVHASVEAARDAHHMVWLLFLGIALLGLVCLIFYFCFQSLGLGVGIGELVLFYVLLQISAYVSVTPGNLGVQELAFGLLGEQIGVGMAEGILVAGLLRVTGYLGLFGVALPMGGLDVLRQSARYRR